MSMFYHFKILIAWLQLNENWYIVKFKFKNILIMPKEIVILPKPVWNVSCHNDKVWHSFEWPSTLVALENVSKFVCLLLLSMAIIITNVIFVLVLMNRRYNRKIFPQVNRKHLNIKKMDIIYIKAWHKIWIILILRHLFSAKVFSRVPWLQWRLFRLHDCIVLIVS